MRISFAISPIDKHVHRNLQKRQDIKCIFMDALVLIMYVNW